MEETIENQTSEIDTILNQIQFYFGFAVNYKLQICSYLSSIKIAQQDIQTKIVIIRKLMEHNYFSYDEALKIVNGES